MWELVEARAAASPDVVALYDGEDREVTFSQLRDRAERVAAGLHAEGVGHGSRVTWQLPTRIKYSNVKLSRPLTWQSHLTLGWFNTYARKTQKHTAIIAALTPDGMPVSSWALNGVLPVKWNGPRLGVTDNTVSIETLELAHEGLISGGIVGAMPAMLGKAIF